MLRLLGMRLLTRLLLLVCSLSLLSILLLSRCGLSIEPNEPETEQTDTLPGKPLKLVIFLTNFTKLPQLPSE